MPENSHKRTLGTVGHIYREPTSSCYCDCVPTFLNSRMTVFSRHPEVISTRPIAMIQAVKIPLTYHKRIRIDSIFDQMHTQRDGILIKVGVLPVSACQ